MAAWYKLPVQRILLLLAIAGCTRDTSQPLPATTVPVEKAAPTPRRVRPASMKDGFHRHDRAVEPALLPDVAPALGQNVKVQINLQPGSEGIGWLAMGGEVTKVISPTEVEAEVVATTDQAPAEYGGVWRVTLGLDREMEFPWTVRMLEQIATKTPAD